MPSYSADWFYKTFTLDVWLQLIFGNLSCKVANFMWNFYYKDCVNSLIWAVAKQSTSLYWFRFILLKSRGADRYSYMPFCPHASLVNGNRELVVDVWPGNLGISVFLDVALFSFSACGDFSPCPFLIQVFLIMLVPVTRNLYIYTQSHSRVKWWLQQSVSIYNISCSDIRVFNHVLVFRSF